MFKWIHPSNYHFEIVYISYVIFFGGRKFTSCLSHWCFKPLMFIKVSTLLREIKESRTEIWRGRTCCQADAVFSRWINSGNKLYFKRCRAQGTYPWSKRYIVIWALSQNHDSVENGVDLLKDKPTTQSRYPHFNHWTMTMRGRSCQKYVAIPKPS